MAVLSPAVVGIVVAPILGKMPCGFMRPIRHRCGDSTCPLNRCFVMAFDPNIKRAIASCRSLWKVDENVQLIYCRLRVNGNTLRIAAPDFEQGLKDGNPADWARLRSQVTEHDGAAMQLTSVGALLSFGGSPGDMWLPEGEVMLLPVGIELERPAVEDESWWDAGAPDPDDLIE
jgi:hypothetical protein